MTAIEWFASAVGAVSAFISGAVWLDGRSDRAERRISDVALKAIEESEKFALQGEQDILHKQLTRDIAEVKSTVKTMDKKLDGITDLMLSARLKIRRDDE